MSWRWLLTPRLGADDVAEEVPLLLNLTSSCSMGAKSCGPVIDLYIRPQLSDAKFFRLAAVVELTLWPGPYRWQRVLRNPFAGWVCESCRWRCAATPRQSGSGAGI